MLRYVYIDRTWDKPDHLAFFVDRMKYAVLATFGLTRYLPSWHLLRVELPPNVRLRIPSIGGWSGIGTISVPSRSAPTTGPPIKEYDAHLDK